MFLGGVQLIIEQLLIKRHLAKTTGPPTSLQRTMQNLKNMSDEKYQNKYRIKSARAEWHDYNGGAYFITVCTTNREHYLGKIRDEQMDLSNTGKYLSENLQRITTHYPYAEIPLFVVMPNHWHAIVFIDANKTPQKSANMDNAHTDVAHQDVARHVSTGNENMKNIRAKQGWLSVVIGGVKSAVTKFARENSIDFAWQTRFDDRIIRDQNMMNKIAEYIENNVARWNDDCFNESETINFQ
jgi:REP element-mobilizing transposase RayT